MDGQRDNIFCASWATKDAGKTESESILQGTEKSSGEIYAFNIRQTVPTYNLEDRNLMLSS